MRNETLQYIAMIKNICETGGIVGLASLLSNLLTDLRDIVLKNVGRTGDKIKTQELKSKADEMIDDELFKKRVGEGLEILIRRGGLTVDENRKMWVKNGRLAYFKSVPVLNNPIIDF